MDLLEEDEGPGERERLGPGLEYITERDGEVVTEEEEEGEEEEEAVAPSRGSEGRDRLGKCERRETRRK